jgi:hypothetical protein
MEAGRNQAGASRKKPARSGPYWGGCKVFFPPTERVRKKSLRPGGILGVQLQSSNVIELHAGKHGFDGSFPPAAQCRRKKTSKLQKYTVTFSIWRPCIVE